MGNKEPVKSQAQTPGYGLLEQLRPWGDGTFGQTKQWSPL